MYTMSEDDASTNKSPSKSVAKGDNNAKSEFHDKTLNKLACEEDADSQNEYKNEKDQVCRDYLHNICNRGKHCKFAHPPKTEDKRDIENYNFCIDFQNNGCRRENCRFIHAPQYDVEAYRATGEVTLDLARAIAAVTKDDTINGVPICKEFQLRKCTRGLRCRFWHVNIQHEKYLREQHFKDQKFGRGPYNSHGHFIAPPMRGVRRPAHVYGDPVDMKRMHYDPHIHEYPDYGFVQNLERKLHEARIEISKLHEDLKRERDRYNDLVALFHRQGNTSVSAPEVTTPYSAHTPSMTVPTQTIPQHGYRRPITDTHSWGPTPPRAPNTTQFF
uniref:Zinc finger CCCH domain-containing protein 10 n=1 Tax=Parastrongyloides trichosuri TaxID=131310 RepID=A0A0N5A543_PARTI